MSRIAQATPEAVAVIPPTVPPLGPYIVATDLNPHSDAACAIARTLADRAGAEIVAVSVIEPANIPTYGVDGTVILLDAVVEPAASREDGVRAQWLRVTGNDAVPVTVRTGERSREIAAAADELDARVVIVGRGRHPATLDRVLSGEAVLGIVQHSHTPVLAVDDALTTAPRRVVIATDFSPFSTYAAQVALTIVTPDAHLWLVHVAPSFDESVPFLRDQARIYQMETEMATAEVRVALRASQATVEPVTLTGRVADELVSFCNGNRADLIVTASHGYGPVRRMVLGSTATSLVRHARCSVLIVPGAARTAAEARSRSGIAVNP